MKAFAKKYPSAALFAGCYIAWALGLVLLHLVWFGVNRAQYANGSFVPGALAIEDFELSQMKLEGGLLVTTDADPQMLLRDRERRIDTLALDIEYTLDPYIVNAFYAAPGEDYSLRRMLYPAGGQGAFTFPPGGGQSLRIDPGTAPGNLLTVHSITVNTPRPFWAFFRFSKNELAVAAVVPGLLACGLSLLRPGMAARKRKKEVAP